MGRKKKSKKFIFVKSNSILHDHGVAETRFEGSIFRWNKKDKVYELYAIIAASNLSHLTRIARGLNCMEDLTNKKVETPDVQLQETNVQGT